MIIKQVIYGNFFTVTSVIIVLLKADQQGIKMNVIFIKKIKQLHLYKLKIKEMLFYSNANLNEILQYAFVYCLMY